MAKAVQEQAVAVWVGLINHIRLEALKEDLQQQEQNLAAAMGSMDWALREIDRLVIKNLGGRTGLHGFLAEVAQCGLENAESHLHGERPLVRWLNDNGPVDLLRGDTKIQLKFVSGGGRLSLNAVAEHLRSYPDFLDGNSVYQIPKDFFDTVRTLYEMPQEQAARLVASDGGPSYGLWKSVHRYFDSSGFDIDDLEPSRFEYAEVQRDAIGDTMARERHRLVEENRRIEDAIAADHAPSLQEAGSAAAAGAALEAGTAFALSLRRHLAEGRRIRDLTEDDWVQIARDSGLGLVRGEVRGGAIYGLTNCAQLPPALANALVTASFGVADCAHRFRSGELTEAELVASAEMACLDAAVGALSSLLGQALVPIPVLGPLVGSAVGTTLYELGKDCLDRRESELVAGYERESAALDEQLAKRYGVCLEDLRRNMATYIDLLDSAFVPNVALAFSGSIELARSLGVPEDQVLHTREEVDDYFVR